jgi:hypothetical protein
MGFHGVRGARHPAGILTIGRGGTNSPARHRSIGRPIAGGMVGIGAKVASQSFGMYVEAFGVVTGSRRQKKQSRTNLTWFFREPRTRNNPLPKVPRIGQVGTHLQLRRAAPGVTVE